MKRTFLQVLAMLSLISFFFFFYGLLKAMILKDLSPSKSVLVRVSQSHKLLGLLLVKKFQIPLQTGLEEERQYEVKVQGAH